MELARGLDVSHWVRPFDWDAVRGACSFAGAKATEGKTYVDATYAAHRDAIRARGFALAIWYHFARWNRPETEAEHLCSTVGPLEPTERLALDLEGNPQPGAFLVDWASRFVERAVEITGRRPLVYTSPRWWRSCGNPDAPDLGSCDLWIPRYRPPELGPGALPRPWQTWHIWQWTDGGKRAPAFAIPGVKGAVDANVFNGDAAALAAYAAR